MIYGKQFVVSLVQKVASSILGYNLQIILEIHDFERGPPTLEYNWVALDVKSREIPLGKLKLRLEDYATVIT